MEKELAEILKDLGLENNTWKKKVLAPYIKRIIGLFRKRASRFRFKTGT